MKLEIKGLTREQEMAWLLKLPWTFMSEPSEDEGEYVIRVAEMNDAMTIGTEAEVSRDIWDALRLSLECRLDEGDPIPLPRAHVIPVPTMVVLRVPSPTEPTEDSTNDE